MSGMRALSLWRRRLPTMFAAVAFRSLTSFRENQRSQYITSCVRPAANAERNGDLGLETEPAARALPFHPRRGPDARFC
jgi:hypothetical protein